MRQSPKHRIRHQRRRVVGTYQQVEGDLQIGLIVRGQGVINGVQENLGCFRGPPGDRDAGVGLGVKLCADSRL